MYFAVINEEDGTIRQINHAIGATETLEELNARLPAGQRAIECTAEVSLNLHVYNSASGRFEPCATS